MGVGTEHHHQGGIVKIILSKRYTWCGLLTLAVVTVLVTGYLIWPIGRALSVAHPRRVAVRHVTPSNFELSYENVKMPTAHGLEVHGWLVPSQNGATVVMAHGFGSNRISTLSPGSKLAEHGFGVLLIDLLKTMLDLQ